MSEKEIMLSGAIYDSNDKELVNLRKNAHKLCMEYNSTPEENRERTHKTIKRYGRLSQPENRRGY